MPAQEETTNHSPIQEEKYEPIYDNNNDLNEVIDGIEMSMSMMRTVLLTERQMNKTSNDQSALSIACEISQDMILKLNTLKNNIERYVKANKV